MESYQLRFQEENSWNGGGQEWAGMAKEECENYLPIDQFVEWKLYDDY